MECKFCKSKIEHPVFDLGNTAISNDLIVEKRLEYPVIRMFIFLLVRYSG